MGGDGTMGGLTAELTRALERAAQAAGDTAAAALERLCPGARVRLQSSRVVSWAGHVAELPGGHLPHVGVVFAVRGTRARVLVAVDAPGAALVAARMLGRPCAAALEGPARDALAEMANIVASSYLTGVARLARVTLVPSVPSLAVDSLHAVAASMAPACDLPPSDAEPAFVSRFEMEFPGGRACGAFVAVPAPVPAAALAAVLAAAQPA